MFSATDQVKGSLSTVKKSGLRADWCHVGMPKEGVWCLSRSKNKIDNNKTGWSTIVWPDSLYKADYFSHKCVTTDICGDQWAHLIIKISKPISKAVD